MTAEASKIRWGVLGYARIARDCVIPAIQRSCNSQFCAIASRDEAKQAECRSRFPGVKVYSSYGELLKDREVDAVYVPLPNSLHCDWTIKALNAGKHVLCEKPLALNAKECCRMIAASLVNQVALMEGFMYRYTARTRLVLEVLCSGALGEIKCVNSTFRFMLSNPASVKLKPELGGGSLYDVGCYPVNFIGMVVDEMVRGGTMRAEESLPQSVSAEWSREGGVDMIFSGVLKYPSGLIATVNCGFNSQRYISSEIIGTKGVLVVPDTFSDNAGAITLITGEERRDFPVTESDRYRFEVEDFAQAILQKRPPQFGLTESRRNIEVMDKLRAAVK